jgi:hypothetical protein
VDSLPLPQTWPRPALVDNGMVYLGHAANWNPIEPLTKSVNGGKGKVSSTGKVISTDSWLETWTLTAQGRFARQAVTKVARPLSALAVFGNLLAAQDTSNGVTLLDVSVPSVLTPCGRGGPSGCLWFNLNHADGALDSGLGIPLDDYGVSFLPVIKPAGT